MKYPSPVTLIFMFITNKHVLYINCLHTQNQLNYLVDFERFNFQELL
jgi:hypothetical protein